MSFKKEARLDQYRILATSGYQDFTQLTNLIPFFWKTPTKSEMFSLGPLREKSSIWFEEPRVLGMICLLTKIPAFSDYQGSNAGTKLMIFFKRLRFKV